MEKRWKGKVWAGEEKGKGGEGDATAPRAWDRASASLPIARRTLALAVAAAADDDGGSRASSWVVEIVDVDVGVGP